MASEETQELIIESIKHYIKALVPEDGGCPPIEDMRKIVKLDDIMQGLLKKEQNE
jgi:hypothetical protein